MGRGEWTSNSNATERALLKRLIAAWERSTPRRWSGCCAPTRSWSTPPRPTWFLGRDAVETFLRDHVFGQLGGRWRLLATANRQPAFGLYWQEPGESMYRQFAIGVLRVDDGAIAEMALFGQPELFESFTLPARL